MLTTEAMSKVEQLELENDQLSRQINELKAVGARGPEEVRRR